METRRANPKTKHGHTFLVKVINAVNSSEFGCSNWEALAKACGFQEDMEITFDLRPEDHIEGNIDIWVDVDMLSVLPPSYFSSSPNIQNIVDQTYYSPGSDLTWLEKNYPISFIDDVENYKINYEDIGTSYSEYVPLVHELNPNNCHVDTM